MIFRETPVAGAFVVQLEPAHDERGFFARTWCAEEYARHGLDSRLAQCSMSFSPRRGTLRGLHWQAVPHEETKTIHCTSGAVFDVVVDLRRESPTYLKWTSVELSAANRLSIYVPPLCAHGFLTLTDDAQIEYKISTPHCAPSARGLRWNDPAIGIRWPIEPTVMSARDRALPTLDQL